MHNNKGKLYFLLNEDRTHIITAVKLFAEPGADSLYIEATDAAMNRYAALYCGYSLSLEEVQSKPASKPVSNSTSANYDAVLNDESLAPEDLEIIRKALASLPDNKATASAAPAKPIDARTMAQKKEDNLKWMRKATRSTIAMPARRKP